MIVSRTLPGGRQIRLEFVCKDPLMSKYYADKFGSQFLDELFKAQLSEETWEGLQRRWNAQMSIEAEKQEHCDYTVVDGIRKPLPGPVLLWPAVVKVT